MAVLKIVKTITIESKEKKRETKIRGKLLELNVNITLRLSMLPLDGLIHAPDEQYFEQH